MIAKTNTLRLAAALVGLLAVPMSAVARTQDPAPKPVPAPAKIDLEALKGRMKARYKKLSELRDSGVVGETFQGYVAIRDIEAGKKPVDPEDPKQGNIASFVDAENEDRKLLYQELAKQLKSSAEAVGAQNGLRNLERAGPEHWFRLANGTWAQRKSIERKKPAPDKDPVKDR